MKDGASSKDGDSPQGADPAGAGGAGPFAATTRDIRVVVEPRFVSEQSDTKRGVYAFAYKVRIENLGELQVQLINRHWRVFSLNRQIADVKGEGVVGLQPVIPAMATFEYESWTVIQDPVGWMEGIYTLVAENGEFFDAVIPRFDLMHIDTSVVH